MVIGGGSLARTHEGARGLPRGRSRLPADAVRSAQRDRLIRAMTAAVAADGYAAVTVASVVRRAKVSRSAFYAHFADKEACLFAASAEGSRQMMAATRTAVRAAGDAPAEDLLRVGLRGFLGFLAAEPAFARVFYVDLPAAGRTAQDREQAAYQRWAEVNRRWHERALAEHPEWPTVPREVYLALAGATGELVRDLVRSGNTDRLPLLEDVLVELHLAVLAGRRFSAAASGSRC